MKPTGFAKISLLLVIIAGFCAIPLDAQSLPTPITAPVSNLKSKFEGVRREQVGTKITDEEDTSAEEETIIGVDEITGSIVPKDEVRVCPNYI